MVSVSNMRKKEIMQFIMFGSEKNKCSPSPRLITRQSHRKFRGKVEQKNNVKKKLESGQKAQWISSGFYTTHKAHGITSKKKKEKKERKRRRKDYNSPKPRHTDMKLFLTHQISGTIIIKKNNKESPPYVYY